MRKAWVLYWSIFQFGIAILSNEDAWFCVVSERSDNCKRLEGGIAQVFTAVLEFLFGPGGHTMQHGGVVLDLYDGTTIHIWIDLFMI